MPAFGHELRSFIQGRVWVGPRPVDVQCFCHAHLVKHCASAVWFGFANDEPFNGRNVTVILIRHQTSFGSSVWCHLDKVIVVVTSFIICLTTAVIWHCFTVRSAY